MRIAELLGEADAPLDRKPMMTHRFEKEYEVAKQFPGVTDKLKEFLTHYRTAPLNSPFNIKDGTLVGYADFGITPPVRRCHLRQGKIILVYQLTITHIRLLAIGSHDIIEAKEVVRLYNYIRRLKDSDFESYQESVKKFEPSPLPKHQVEELQGLMQMLRGDDEGVQVLQGVIKGGAQGLETFMQWARTTIDVSPTDTSHDGLILRAFGGKSGLVSVTQRVLNVPQASKP